MEFIGVKECRLVDLSPERCGVSKSRSHRRRLLRCGGNKDDGEVDLVEGRKKITAVLAPLGRRSLAGAVDGRHGGMVAERSSGSTPMVLWK